MHGRCMGTNRDGSPCSGQARPGRSMCAWHDPQLAADRAAWRRKGGQSRSNKARAKKALPDNVLSMVEIQGLLGLAFKGVMTGKLEPNVGTVLANLARTMAQVAGVAEIEEQIAELRQRIEGRAS